MPAFENPAFGGKFAAFVISEAMGLRSRQNYLVSLGKKLKAGEVAKLEAGEAGPWLVSGDTPAGISVYDVDATDRAIMASFIARDAEVNLRQLIFPANADVIADLEGIGIICRD